MKINKNDKNSCQNFQHVSGFLSLFFFIVLVQSFSSQRCCLSSAPKYTLLHDSTISPSHSSSTCPLIG